jgi:pyruvate kinase
VTARPDRTRGRASAPAEPLEAAEPAPEPSSGRGAPRRRRTKIVCTLGPASDSPEHVEALLDAGMDVARLNFSHGTREEHAARIRRVREIAARRNRAVAVLQDLAGPKIRVGDLQRGRVRLAPGAVVRLTNEEILGTPERIPTTYRDLPRDVSPGDSILLDDGLLRLLVESVEDGEVAARVIEGGVLLSGKGLNLPGVEVGAPSLTPKDEEDVRFGLEHGVDLIALSFVRSAGDVVDLRARMGEAGRDVPVIAKLEKPQAIANLEEILGAAEGVMIARGDLGVEIPLERVPIIQKEVIRRAASARRLVIVATQMLNSMTDHPRPTRAETSDVSNAILDGTDAVMLSSETASGRHPIEAVDVMDRIVRAAEDYQLESGWIGGPALHPGPAGFTQAISDVACQAAQETGARLIACFTQSGRTAALLSKNRPAVPLVAFTPYAPVRNRMAALWGVDPYVMEIPDNIDRLIERLDRRLAAEGLAASGDPVVIVCGAPLDVGGRTNLLKLHRVGEVERHAGPARAPAARPSGPRTRV